MTRGSSKPARLFVCAHSVARKKKPEVQNIIEETLIFPHKSAGKCKPLQAACAGCVIADVFMHNHSVFFHITAL